MNKCSIHQMTNCVPCFKLPRFLPDYSPQKAPSGNVKYSIPWMPAEEDQLKALQFVTDTERRRAFTEIAAESGRSRQAVYGHYMIVTGEAGRRGWRSGSDVLRQ